jgi:hypothetical protein
MSDSKRSRYAKWLLGGLLVVWCIVSLNAIRSLEREGAAVCDRLTDSVEQYPSTERPCRVERYGPDGAHLSSKRFQFEDGELAAVTFDRDSDGAFEAQVDCSLVGRILMPLTHTGDWLTVVLSNDARSRGEQLDYVERGSEQDGAERVIYFEAVRKANGQTRRRRDRRDAEDRLIERRFFIDGRDEAIRTLALRYDTDGRLLAVERTSTFPPSESTTRMRYEACGGAD